MIDWLSVVEIVGGAILVTSIVLFLLWLDEREHRKHPWEPISRPLSPKDESVIGRKRA